MTASETAIGRARLEREVVARGKAGRSAGRTRRRSSKRFLPLVAIGGMIAAAAFGVALLPPAPIVVKAEAAELLLTAADQVEFESPRVAPGQYLRIERNFSELAKTFDSTGAEVFFMQSGESEATLQGEGDDLIRDGVVDALGESLFRLEFIRLVGANQTPAAEAAARDAVEHEGISAWGGLVAAISGDGVRQIEKNPADLEQPQDPYSIEQTRVPREYFSTRERHLKAPRDPASLRQYILSDVGPHDTSDDEAVFEWVRQVIFDPSLPAELRAAGFRVLADLQGATINDDQTKFGGRAGTSLSFSARGDTREELVFDSGTGELLGTQTVLVKERGNFQGVPVGTVIFSVELEVSVVGSATSGEEAG